MKYSRLLVGGSLLTCACGPEGAEELLGADQAPITGGRLVPSSGHGAPDTSVVKFERKDPFGGLHYCSALKVASNVYWTAGHCFDVAPAVGQTIRITNSLSGDLSNTSSTYTRTLASFQVHPSRKNYANGIALGKAHKHYDVARFTLSATTSNIPSYSTTDPGWVTPNQAVTFTGYGCDAINDPGIPSWQGGSHSGRKQYEFFDLVDEPTFGAVYGQLPNVTPDIIRAYFAHNMPALGVPEGCQGDSGSPVWKKFGTTWKNIGIVVHGGTPDVINGYSGFARYSNVQNWLANPAVNQFEVGFQGFILNKYTGRCLGRANSAANWVREENCEGSAQDNDRQSWRLASGGSMFPGTFFIVNGNGGGCLEEFTNSEESPLIAGTCRSSSEVGHRQRWRFAAASNNCNGACVGDYRVLQNVDTGRCIAPSDPTSDGNGFVRSYPCQSFTPGAHYQSWLMTR